MPTAALSSPPPVTGKRQHSARVILTQRAPAELAGYKDISEFPLDEANILSGSEEPYEIVGEYISGDDLFYYAKLPDGLAYRFTEIEIQEKHTFLLADYEYRKTRDLIKPFDPSASYVHPDSRIHITITLNKTRAISVGSPSSELDLEYPEDIPESTPAVSEDDYEDDIPLASQRSSKRRLLKVNLKLPFSPRKTRARNVAAVIDTDENSSSEAENTQPRRSARTRAPTKASLGHEEYRDQSGSDSSDGFTLRPANKLKKKAKRECKSAPPAYGYVRDVSDLGYDSDEDTAPLRAHRDTCERCKSPAAHVALAKLKKKPGRRRTKKAKDDFEESEDEEERLSRLGGWMRCLKCPVAAHWGCLASSQRDEILKAVRERDLDTQQAKRAELAEGEEDMDMLNTPRKRQGLEIQETSDFTCGSCAKGSTCLGCLEPVPLPDNHPNLTTTTNGDGEVKMADAMDDPNAEDSEPISQLLFRCSTCKRPAHYAHLPWVDEDDIVSTAVYHQKTTVWQCSDCYSFVYNLDRILAWRPWPADAKEPTGDSPPDYTSALPREYLVKWGARGYNRAQWVPHMWLLATNKAKLKNFTMGGTKVELLASPELDNDEEVRDGDIISEEDHEGRMKAVSWSDPLPNAERHIPRAWKTVDRVLDIKMFVPLSEQTGKKGKNKGQLRKRVESVDPEDESQRSEAYERGEEPSATYMEDIDSWEKRTGEELAARHADLVIWAFFKWDDLGYDEATWDAPPRKEDPGYDAYVRAFNRFLLARRITKPKGPKPAKRVTNRYSKFRLMGEDQPQLGQDPKWKLMDYQIDGFNWLCDNWWNTQHCILADEMGLGKTIQIATFLGTVIKRWNAYPALVVVPNSTITNWVREFERWAPEIFVVPFYGEAKARNIIVDFELAHFHVLITTYEAITNARDFSAVFKKQPRWEVLVVDEGQRLKSDRSLIFKKLNDLNTQHRVIMTGTPLNNKIRELFNLMNFLDPNGWKDLEQLEKEHEELSEERVKHLHARLRPYFLRRTKKEVLKLPPKNEVIVPVSMAPLQKEIYRGILKGNLEILKSLQASAANAKATQISSRTNMNNMLMQLRKCLQHPYLVSEDIEPRNLSPQATHDKLIEASTKLRLLKMLLPKLKARGHRVLLFSQFMLALDVIEDFLVGEKIKYLRLDGNTASAKRQKGMDEFNKPGSDVFIYLLTTRAGGVGINLWSADTVIIFDPDFNPQQDLQAISRSHRFGQQKTVLVFKFMVKDSAEERMMQVAKKKLVLDHVIVQRMDDTEDAGNDVQSVLMHGAQTLFTDEADQSSRDITYTDADVDHLIEKTEKEREQQDEVKESGFSFSFAKVWATERSGLDELPEADDAKEEDSWAVTLRKIEEEAAKARALDLQDAGRGKRRRPTAAPAQQLHLGDSPPRDQKGKQRATLDDDYSIPADSDSDSDDSESYRDPEELVDMLQNGKRSRSSATPEASRVPVRCGICGDMHSGRCSRTEDSDNLAEYRRILLTHEGNEAWEERREAIQRIEEVLFERGHIAKIGGQPLHLLGGPPPALPHAAGGPADKGKKPRGRPAKIPKLDGGPSAIGQPTVAKNGAAGSGGVGTSSGSNGPTKGLSNRAGADPPLRAAAGPSAQLGKAIVADGNLGGTLQQANVENTPCMICGKKPLHLPKHCPVALEGPTRIVEAIKRLEERPERTAVQTVAGLRKLLTQVKKAELARTQDADAMQIG